MVDGEITLDVEIPDMEEYYDKEIREKTIEKLSCKLMTYFADCQLTVEDAIVRDVLDGVIESIDKILEQMKEVGE